MLVAAAICPPTSLIVHRLHDLHTSCRVAIDALHGARPDVLIVVGGAKATIAYGGGTAGTLRPWGLDVTEGSGEPLLPLSLTVARTLLDGHVPDTLQSVAFDAAKAECQAIGEKIGKMAERVALLVMADGSACLTPKAPGRYDEAAQPYNDLIATAISEADPAALAALDPSEADRLWVAGRAAFQVLAGAAGAAKYRGRLLASAAPFGVGYFAGLWTT
ncbi:hypothetical protein ABZ897_13820 [Nonomuraea sp. NPDC046802]|uniref:hypothetical protein n=1 Tax=Nonomuraea sp. NPDC046802 TaxID=3154919 RepID=UPI0033EA0C1B